jgi:hypothetical protein
MRLILRGAIDELKIALIINELKIASINELKIARIYVKLKNKLSIGFIMIQIQNIILSILFI